MSMLVYYSSILFWAIISFCYHEKLIAEAAVSFPNIAILSSRGTSSGSSTAATKKSLVLASSTSDGIADEIVTTTQSSTEMPSTKTKNIVFQLGGYIKDSLTRFKDGTVELYTNYQKCQTIRKKEKEFQTIYYKDSSNRNNMGIYKKRGITYQEFDFLQKQKVDRGKLGNILFLLFFAPNIMPYSIMFFPDMLPSPFHAKSTTLSSSASNNIRYSSASRQISHAVLKTLIDIEKLGSNDSNDKSSSPSLIPFGFGKKKAEQKIQQMKELLYLTTSFLGSSSSFNTNVPLLLHEDNDENSSKVSSSTSTPIIIQQIITKLHDQIYSNEKPTKDQTRFVTVPKPILKGISCLLPSSSSPSFFESFIPNFMIRNNILKHIQKISDSDEFLINEDIDFNTIDNDSLREICMDRCIAVSSNDNDDTSVLHEKLANWLQFTVVQPRLYQYSPQVLNSDSTNSTKVFPTASDLKKLKFEGVSLLESKAENNNNGQVEHERFEYYNGNLARLMLLCNNAITSTVENHRTSILPRLIYSNTPSSVVIVSEP